MSALYIYKNLEEQDVQKQLLYYVSLIRACNKVLVQLVYIGKKFVILKKNLGKIMNQLVPIMWKNVLFTVWFTKALNTFDKSVKFEKLLYFLNLSSNLI